MNEKAVFFFQRRKKNTASRSIEWMTCELLQEKKNTQKTPKNLDKKNTPHFQRKLRKTRQNLNEWFMNFFWEKKIHLCSFFFFLLRGKTKKTKVYDLIEWMAHELYQEKKIRYLWFYVFSVFSDGIGKVEFDVCRQSLRCNLPQSKQSSIFVFWVFTDNKGRAEP